MPQARIHPENSDSEYGAPMALFQSNLRCTLQKVALFFRQKCATRTFVLCNTFYIPANHTPLPVVRQYGGKHSEFLVDRGPGSFLGDSMVLVSCHDLCIYVADEVVAKETHKMFQGVLVSWSCICLNAVMSFELSHLSLPKRGWHRALFDVVPRLFKLAATFSFGLKCDGLALTAARFMNDPPAEAEPVPPYAASG